MSSLRILVADDHDLMRRGIKALLESHPGWGTCGEARTGREAITKIEELKPDIAILDVNMPDLDGLAAARTIRRVSPQTEILVLSVHYSDQLTRDILQAGVRGYILKSDSDRDLVVAIEALSKHKPFFTPCATEVMLNNSSKASGMLVENPEDMKDRLTPRERETVQLIAQGKSSKEVGSILGISAKTVETHRANIMRKLQLHSLSELVRYALRNQIAQA